VLRSDLSRSLRTAVPCCVNELVALGLGVGCMLLILIVIPVDSASSSDGSPFSAVDSSTASS
jgi:hypothetical protein